MYNTAMSEYIRVSKAVIVNEKGKALVVFRGSTAPSRALTWDLPGGIVEDGETTLQTVQREVLEETGLNIQADSFSKTDKYTDHRYCWTVYKAKVGSELVEISWEHDEYKWVDRQEIKGLKNTPAFLKQLILNVIS